jgi:hypothetical protein
MLRSFAAALLGGGMVQFLELVPVAGMVVHCSRVVELPQTLSLWWTRVHVDVVSECPRSLVRRVDVACVE